MVADEPQLEAEIAVLRAENARLEGRVAEMHQAMVRITQDTPYAEELQSNATLIAEVGTLRNKLRELTETAKRAVAIADEGWTRAQTGPYGYAIPRPLKAELDEIKRKVEA